MKDIVVDEIKIEKIYIKEKEYQKIKNELNKIDNFFREEEILKYFASKDYLTK